MYKSTIVLSMSASVLAAADPEVPEVTPAPPVEGKPICEAAVVTDPTVSSISIS